MKRIETVFYYLMYSIVLIIIGLIFYRSLIASFILIPFSIFFVKRKEKKKMEKEKMKVNLQFRELLYSISSSLRAGRSLESAFKQSIKDLNVIFTDPNTLIIIEIEKIVAKIEMNVPIEEAFMEFSKKYKIDEIVNFAQIMEFSRMTGIDLIEVIKNTSEIISEKITIKQEIEVMLARKVMETNLLTFFPIIFLLFLSISSYEYMKPIYETIAGRMIMTFALIIIFGSNLLVQKILKIGFV